MIFTRRLASLFLLLTLLVMVGPTAAQDDPLTQTYASSDGQFAFQYPEGWTLDEFFGSVYMMNDPAILEMALSLTLTELSPGQVFISLATPASMIEGGLNESANPMELLGYMMIGSGSDETPTEMTIAGVPGAKASVQLQGLPYTAYVWQPAEGVFHLLLMLTAPGEESLFEPTALAIAETVVYNPPPMPIEQGSIIWEVQNEAIYPPPTPDVFYRLGPIVVGPDGLIYVADGDKGIQVYTEAGAFVKEITLEPEGFLTIYDLAFAPDGSLWVAEPDNQALHQFDPSGDRVAVYQGDYDGSFEGPRQIEIGPDGTIYLLDWLVDEEDDYVGSRVRVLDSHLVPMTEFPVESGLDELADDIEIGPDGNLYVLNDGDVRIFDAAGTLIADPVHVLAEPASHFAIGADGSIYFDLSYGPIVAYDAAGNYLYQYGQAVEYNSLEIEDGEIAEVQGMAVLPNGDLLIADTNFEYTRLVRLTFAQ
ncbi:MAG: hypothetical protein BroJett018_46280 [Chloroflexota bacterium]|nr:MAG: hypothetical protein BroJett018_46280 [Chloroflexota bacterium]